MERKFPFLLEVLNSESTGRGDLEKEELVEYLLPEEQEAGQELVLPENDYNLSGSYIHKKS